MSELRDNASYYDSFSTSYENRRGRGYHLFLDEMECELLRRYSEPGARVLEVGCGTGLIMDMIRPHVRSIVGVDLSQGMLEHALQKGLPVTRADVGRLPFAGESFDLVYSFKVLAHVPAIRDALNEVERVLRPGGRAVVEFYNVRSLRSLRKRLIRGRVAPGIIENEVFTRHDTFEEIQGYLPNRLRLERFHGIMILTPAAQFHAIPLVGHGLRVLERIASRSPLRKFGGFLSAVVRKAQ